MSLLRKHHPWSFAESSSHEELLTASSFESIGQNKKASPEAKPLEKSKTIGFDSRRGPRALVARGRGRPPEVRSVPLVLRIHRTEQKKQARRFRLRACFFGLPDRIRTYGLQSRSLSLYPAGLRVDIQASLYHFSSYLSRGKRALFARGQPNEKISIY